VRELVVRKVLELPGARVEWAAITSIAAKVGVAPEVMFTVQENA